MISPTQVRAFDYATTGPRFTFSNEVSAVRGFLQATVGTFREGEAANISQALGGSPGRELGPDDLEGISLSILRISRRRSTLYSTVPA
jgi:hypothetical protein